MIIDHPSIRNVFLLFSCLIVILFLTESIFAVNLEQRNNSTKRIDLQNKKPRTPTKEKTPKSAHADLKVTAIVITPTIPKQDIDYAKITVTVQNIGGTRTSAKCSLNMSIWSVNANGDKINGRTSLSNLIPMYANNIVRLNPGQKTKISAFHTFSFGGRHKVYGHINTESLEPGEEKHQNNQYEKIFSVKASRPDLVICFKKSNISKRYAKNYYPAKIKNISKTTCPAGCKLFFQISDKGTKSWTLPEIEPHQIINRQRAVYWGHKGLGVHSFQIRIACPVGSEEVSTNNIFEGHIRVRRLIGDSSDGWSNSATVCSDSF